jgi:hypothetical protein
MFIIGLLSFVFYIYYPFQARFGGLILLKIKIHLAANRILIPSGAWAFCLLLVIRSLLS